MEVNEKIMEDMNKPWEEKLAEEKAKNNQQPDESITSANTTD